MIVTTTNEIAGHSITGYLGIVRGIVVRRPQGVFVNLDTYARESEETRRAVFDQMVAQARQLGADAIVGMRFDAANFGEFGTEVLAYGTAVKLAPAGTVVAQAVPERAASKSDETVFIQ